MGGGGSTYDYGFRIYNPSIAKFLSVDPLASSFPWNSPYSYAEGDVIRSIDLDGLEKFIVTIDEVQKISIGEEILKLKVTRVVDENGFPVDQEIKMKGSIDKITDKDIIIFNNQKGRMSEKSKLDRIFKSTIEEGSLLDFALSKSRKAQFEYSYKGQELSGKKFVKGNFRVSTLEIRNKGVTTFGFASETFSENVKNSVNNLLNYLFNDERDEKLLQVAFTFQTEEELNQPKEIVEENLKEITNSGVDLIFRVHKEFIKEQVSNRKNSKIKSGINVQTRTIKNETE